MIPTLHQVTVLHITISIIRRRDTHHRRRLRDTHHRRRLRRRDTDNLRRTKEGTRGISAEEATLRRLRNLTISTINKITTITMMTTTVAFPFFEAASPPFAAVACWRNAASFSDDLLSVC
ncbi:uncharacterized protein LOC112091513 [Morus notabilis]|uniref:uncharacterized protein LOC112091513 n=1 Tax=Morus notabilis TaxID=981085 RepID=UPI000CED00E3|nr:uncharacterized protein LOC112091513 [Morus notabilis]